MKPLVTGTGMVKSFGEGTEKRRVLDQVCVEIREGEFVSVMGPSGSGKTTLLFALSGMDTLDEGEVLFRGKRLSDLTEREHAALLRREIGFVFQQPTLLRNLNILDNIILPSIRDRRTHRGTVNGKARLLMQQMGIQELEQREITRVSGGQLQRAGICRALMGDPGIIFGDEPTGALDSSTAQEIMDILSSIHKGGTAVMLVTHDVKVAARTNRTLFMKDGKIIGELTVPDRDEKNTNDRTDTIISTMRELGL
jgi:putative ABC transport system ATP-binding protein